MSRIIELPCMIDDSVYEIKQNQIRAYTIISVHLTKQGCQFGWEWRGRGFYQNMFAFTDKDIGKTVFLTKEEAEQALRREYV